MTSFRDYINKFGNGITYYDKNDGNEDETNKYKSINNNGTYSNDDETTDKTKTFNSSKIHIDDDGIKHIGKSITSIPMDLKLIIDKNSVKRNVSATELLNTITYEISNDLYTDLMENRMYKKFLAEVDMQYEEIKKQMSNDDQKNKDKVEKIKNELTKKVLLKHLLQPYKYKFINIHSPYIPSNFNLDIMIKILYSNDAFEIKSQVIYRIYDVLINVLNGNGRLNIYGDYIQINKHIITTNRFHRVLNSQNKLNYLMTILNNYINIDKYPVNDLNYRYVIEKLRLLTSFINNISLKTTIIFNTRCLDQTLNQYFEISTMELFQKIEGLNFYRVMMNTLDMESFNMAMFPKFLISYTLMSLTSVNDYDLTNSIEKYDVLNEIANSNVIFMNGIMVSYNFAILILSLTRLIVDINYNKITDQYIPTSFQLTDNNIVNSNNVV